MKKSIKINKKWLFGIIPSIILIIVWYFKNNYEVWDMSGFKVTFYPNKDKPKIIKAYRTDKKGNTVEDYIFIKFFSRWWEYNFIDKMGFFVDSVEFNGGKIQDKKNSYSEFKQSTKSTSAVSKVDAK